MKIFQTLSAIVIFSSIFAALPALAQRDALDPVQIKNYSTLNSAFSSIFSVYRPSAEQLKLGDIQEANIKIQTQDEVLADGRIQRVVHANISSAQLPKTYSCTFTMTPSKDSTPQQPESESNLDCNFPQ